MRQNFIVSISHLQNATWQGSVTWVEKNKTQSFRSALELIRLIDSATDGSQDPAWQTEEHAGPQEP